MRIYLSFMLVVSAITGCNQKGITEPVQSRVYLGADLSYVNEMLDCGGQYRENGEVVDPYTLFAKKGANLVRLRLWNSPDWTNYSNFEDVKKAIRLTKENGMSVLLDFHYSDSWADPGKQMIPKAWAGITSLEILGDSVYNYTYRTLRKLNDENLLPEMVQIGNETNSEILKKKHADQYDSINWKRNIYLFNRGLQAANDISNELGKPIETMIHIAQPENALDWFPKAFENGIQPFHWIGLSYYPKWSAYSMSQLSEAIEKLKNTYDKGVMIVETAYPYTLHDADLAGNILGKEALIDQYPPTPSGQKNFMIDLTRIVLEGGGSGVIYWEPAWISTPCHTRWGQGSHWDNATFFDASNGNESLESFDFYNQSLY